MDRLQCRARVRRLLLFVGLVFVVLPVGSALAATTTIGQTGPPLTGVPFAFAAGSEGAPYTITVAGTVTGFQSQSRQQQDCGEPDSFDFQVLRPLGGDQYQVVGHTGRQLEMCDGQVDFYPAHITVQAGDMLGFFAITNWHGMLVFGAPKFPSSFSTNPSDQPQVGDTIELAVGGGNVPAAQVDESATLVTSELGNGKNTPNGRGPLANPSPQSPIGRPHGCDNGEGWKIGAATRC
jgi:hypothetical protein